MPFASCSGLTVFLLWMLRDLLVPTIGSTLFDGAIFSFIATTFTFHSMTGHGPAATGASY